MTYTTRFQYLYDKARLMARGDHAIKPGGLPPLFFFTDPKRTPRPEDIAALLPAGCGVVYRHFGEPDAAQRARSLRRIADERGLTLLIGEDEALAHEIGADGVHLAERSQARAERLKAAAPDLILTAACHDIARLEALPGHDILSAVFISPVFASHSASAQGVAALGVKGVREFTGLSHLPIYGLGGINCDTITQLSGSGLAGVAGVDTFQLN